MSETVNSSWHLHRTSVRSFFFFYFLVFLSAGPQCTRQRRTWCCSIHWNSGIRRRSLVGCGDAETRYGIENSVTLNFVPRALSLLSRRRGRTLRTRLNNSNQRIVLGRKSEICFVRRSDDFEERNVRGRMHLNLESLFSG